MKKIIINKGFFWSAGDKYWKTGLDKYSREGVGVPFATVRENPSVALRVSDKWYIVMSDDVRAFLGQYNALEMRGGTKLVIIPKSLLKLVKEDNEEVDNEPKQKNLFEV